MLRQIYSLVVVCVWIQSNRGRQWDVAYDTIDRLEIVDVVHGLTIKTHHHYRSIVVHISRNGSVRGEGSCWLRWIKTQIKMGIRKAKLMPILVNSHSYNRSILYLLARQCRIKRLSFSTMAGVPACS